MALQRSFVSRRTHQDVLDAFDQAPAAIALFEGDQFRLRFCNAQYEALVGRSLPLGESLWHLLPETRDSQIPELMAQVLVRGETIVRQNVPFTLNARPDGQERVVMNFTYAPWRDSHSRIRGVLVSVVDITVQTQAVAQAAAGDARLKAMADALPHCIFICESSGKMRWVNQRWKAMTGLTEKDFGHIPWECIVHPEDHPLVISSWEEAITAQGTFDIYARIKHRQSTDYRWQRLMARSYAENNPSDLVWVCTWTDVHERVILELANATARKSYVATLTHDLRSPLAGIRASTENMLRKDGSKLFEKKFERIIRSVDRADDMLRSLLDVDRLAGGGHHNLEFKALNLGDLLSEVVANHAAVHGDRCKAQLPLDLVGYWHGPSLLRAVDNLLGNAFKYGNAAGVVALSVKCSEGWCYIMVHNMGNPIPEADQARMFVPYERGNTGLALGWGLGLSMVADVARRHQGRVAVSSDEATGTTFTLSLPRFANGCASQELAAGA